MNLMCNFGCSWLEKLKLITASSISVYFRIVITYFLELNAKFVRAILRNFRAIKSFWEPSRKKMRFWKFSTDWLTHTHSPRFYRLKIPFNDKPLVNFALAVESMWVVNCYRSYIVMMYCTVCSELINFMYYTTSSN